jgi:ubiquitin fusion degradation protein 1
MLSLYPPPSCGSLIQPPAAFLGTGNSLNGRDTGSSTQSAGKGKSKATEDTGTKKEVDETRWGTGQGRSLGSRPSNGVDTRTFGAGLVGVGGASVPRLSQRSKKPRRRERSPTPDFGIDDDDVIVIDSDVD